MEMSKNANCAVETLAVRPGMQIRNHKDAIGFQELIKHVTAQTTLFHRIK